MYLSSFAHFVDKLIHTQVKDADESQSTKGIKRVAVTLQSPTQKKSAINLWRDKSELI